MCGIAGFFLKEKTFDQKKVLIEMNSNLSHRGPDGEGFYFDENVSFAHKRLAIIDLNTRSNQPFLDESKQYIITFNGEIYNYLEIKKLLTKDGFKFVTSGDTEVLLNSYIKWGPDLLKRIKGMFSFAIYDKKKKQVFCARDHFGQKPFFYYFKDGNFIFSSELTSLISNPAIKKEISQESIHNYLHYDSFVGRSTPIKDCYKLLPSEYLLFNINTQSILKSKYWDINIKEDKIKIEDYYEKFIDKITKSTELHLRSDVPIALYLSGGVDSSTLACISKKILKNNNIDAFNLKFKNTSFNENLSAKETARELDLNLKTFNLEDVDFLSILNKSINSMDEPLADNGFLAITFIANFVAKDGYKVVISGDGGDEMMMGYEPFHKYWLYKIMNSSIITRSISKKIAKIIPDNFDYMGLSYKLKIFSRALGYKKQYSNTRWIGSFMPEEIDHLFLKENSNLKQENLHNEIYSYIVKIINSIESKNEFDQLSAQYQKHFLSNLICSHTDKANMQYSIEARSPFLDPDLFDFANNLPKNAKMKNGSSKLILRDFLKKNLKNKIYKNPKKGFTVPMANWLKNELRELVFDTLTKSTVVGTGFLKYDYLNTNIIKPHMENKSNNHKKIWNIFVLVNWLKINKLI